MSDKIDNRITFRAKPQLQIQLKTIHGVFGYSSISDTVRRLVELGIEYHELKKTKATELKSEMRKWGIEALRVD